MFSILGFCNIIIFLLALFIRSLESHNSEKLSWRKGKSVPAWPRPLCVHIIDYYKRLTRIKIQKYKRLYQIFCMEMRSLYTWGQVLYLSVQAVAQVTLGRLTVKHSFLVLQLEFADHLAKRFVLVFVFILLAKFVVQILNFSFHLKTFRSKYVAWICSTETHSLGLGAPETIPCAHTTSIQRS